MSRQHRTKEAILRTLRGRRPTATAELANEADAHPAVVDRCCTGLQRSGYIQQTAPGVYTLTRTGEAYLDESSPE